MIKLDIDQEAGTQLATIRVELSDPTRDAFDVVVEETEDGIEVSVVRPRACEFATSTEENSATVFFET